MIEQPIPGSPLAVCVMPPPAPNAARTAAYPQAIHEILGHAGVCYDTMAVDDLPSALPRYRVLLTVGDADLKEEARAALRRWVLAGGAWLAVAGTCGLADLLDVEVEAPAYSVWGGGGGTLGEGYLTVDHRLHPVLAHLEIPLHFFNGLPVRPHDRPLAGVSDAHQRHTRRAALVETGPGQGHCLLVAPDITGAVVRIRQGVGATRDGVSSPDGTAAICDDVLKSDDGAALDWHFDRLPLRGVPGLNVFSQPVADQWAELLLRALFYLASGAGVSLPVLWLYPRNVSALAHLSHDSDLNEPGKARRMLDALRSLDLASTWCIVLPGYPPDLMTAIRAAGHELATHFDAMTEGCPFTEAEFDRQHSELVGSFQGDAPVTNKNHYLRWEGDTEFFEWLIARGIRLDESKGASKTGEAGFNFGTCHPYRPIAPDGSTLDILELPTLSQDLMVFAPRELLSPLLEAAERHHGILHLLFHPAHIDKPGVEDALRGAVGAARMKGFEWWTARRIEAWERARRAVVWSGYSQRPGGASVMVTTPGRLEGATLMWLAPSAARVSVDGATAEDGAVVRWGFRFQTAVLDMESEHRLAIGRVAP
ncbi:MAG TPA: hypothetical protein VGM37_18010 [Armatimonadota bacterium]|jgi:hypothetical protein